MVISRDIAPREQKEARSRESRVKESAIVDVLSRHGGCSCDEIADLLDKDFSAVERVLRQMEIAGKVTPKMVRTGHRWRDRECRYYLPQERSQKHPEKIPRDPSTPKKDPKKNPRKPQTKCSESDRSRKYNPPFVDSQGNVYRTKQAVADQFNASFDLINHWLCSGRLGSNGNSPTITSSQIIHNPPYTDQQGNQYQSRQEIIDTLGVSRKELNRLLCIGKIASNGKSYARKAIEKKNPPFRDWKGNFYQSRDELCVAFEVSRRKVNDWLASGVIGSNGRKGRCSRNSPRSFKPPFVDQEGNQYKSRQEIKKRLNLSDARLTGRLAEGSIGSSGNFPTRRKKKRPVTDGFHVYPSTKDCAIAYNLSPRTINHRLVSHNYPNWHYTQPSRHQGKARSVTDGSQTYPSIRACAIAHGITDRAVAYRISARNNWTNWSYCDE